MTTNTENSINKPVDDKKESLVQQDTKEQSNLTVSKTEKTEKTVAIKFHEDDHPESPGINWKGVFAVIGSVLLQLVIII